MNEFEIGGNERENLELVLVTASLNHAYAQKEYEKATSLTRKEELLARMSHLKALYFNARESMLVSNPDKLEAIEYELRQQKQEVFPDQLH